MLINMSVYNETEENCKIAAEEMKIKEIRKVPEWKS